VSLSPELVALEVAIDGVVAADPRMLPAAQRLAHHERLLQLRSRLEAAELHSLQALHEDEVTVEECGRPTKSWLVEEAHLNPGEAGTRLRLSRGLAAYPRVDAGLGAGAFSPEHARVILNALAVVPPQFLDIVETALLELAPQVTPHDLGEKDETLLVACGVESSAEAAAQKRLARRGFHLARTFNGMRAVSGLLTPEVGEALELAFSQLAQPAGDEDDRSTAQRQHDALGDLAAHYLAHADLPAVNGERPRIVVTLDYDTLVADLHDAWARLPSGATISPATARRLACDAEIIPAVLNARGDVLDIAIGSRTFSTAVRRAALLEQHGRCGFPGCRRRPADCHHIVWWSKGGRSTLDNAAWLCAFHHWLLHERGWSMRREKDRSFTFTNPAGIEYRKPTAA
jgi:hypothetical protein